MKPNNYSANNNGGVTTPNFITNAIQHFNTESYWLCTAEHLARQTAQGKCIQTLPRVKINKIIRGINDKKSET